MRPSPKHHYITGLAVGLDRLTNFKFKPDKPFAGCRLCGEVYQTHLDRTATDPLQVAIAAENRKQWSNSHARKRHTPSQHNLLALSGHWCTPEAAHRMAAFGVIPVTDMVRSREHSEALATAPSVPSTQSLGA